MAAFSMACDNLGCTSRAGSVHTKLSFFILVLMKVVKTSGHCNAHEAIPVINQVDEVCLRLLRQAAQGSQ